MGSGGGVFALSTYMGGTRGSGVLSSSGEVLEMSVVSGVGVVCDMYMSWLGTGCEVLGVSGCPGICILC